MKRTVRVPIKCANSGKTLNTKVTMRFGPGTPLYEVNQECIWAETARVRILEVNPKGLLREPTENVYLVVETEPSYPDQPPIRTTAHESLLKPIHPLILLAELAE